MNKKLMTLNRCDKCHKEIEIYKLNALYSDSFFPNGYICNDCLINYPELGSMLKDSATQMEKIIPKIDEIPIPEEPPKPDPLVECRIRITLIEGGEYTLSLIHI